MTLALGIAAVLALACALAMVQLARVRPPHWFWLLPLQVLCAALLYLTLLPPPVAGDAGTLVIATEGSTPAQLARLRGRATVFALPEAPVLRDAERVPDLGTALRRRPETTRLQVLGTGLTGRDRDALGSQALAFAPSPLPRGLVALTPPARVTPGRRWQVRGRVHDVASGSMRLLDPAGRVVDRAALAADGGFQLQGMAPAAGRVAFRLQLRDARGAVVETIPLPLQVQAGARPRLLLLSGGASPELKYLQRWATDAGFELRARIELGRGLAIGDPAPSFDAAGLREFDLVVLDERAWRALGPGRRESLLAAVREGLGVMLRLTGPLSAAERTQWRALGFGIDDAAIVRSIDWPVPGAQLAAAAEREPPPSLTRQPIAVRAASAAPLLLDPAGAPLALWRPVGLGRLGLWWLGDSHRLVLAGHGAEHGRLWGEALGQLARAHAAQPATFDSDDPRPRQRLVLCNLAPGASIESPAGRAQRLLIAEHGDRRACAAFWPTRAGWHLLRNGGTTQHFVVRAAGEAPGLQAAANREATLRRVTAVARDDAGARARQPGPRWPWFLAWLLASAASWSLERRGRR